jgi:hypothetical protein
VPELTVVVPPTVIPIGIGIATLPIDIVEPPARYSFCCIAKARPVKSWRWK